jgi:hypothetical protein
LIELIQDWQVGIIADSRLTITDRRFTIAATFILFKKINIAILLFWQNIYGGEIWKHRVSVSNFIKALCQVMLIVIKR